MSTLPSTLPALAVLVPAAVGAWLLSVASRDVSIVDSFWPLFLLAAGLTYYVVAPAPGPFAGLTLVLAGAWALRLCVYLTWRNWGEPEDRRYQAIRARNEPRFWLKSLYLVFLLQAVLAWIVSWCLYGAITVEAPLHSWHAAGAALAAFGIAYEAVADWQLARFRARRPGPDAVLDSGLWRYSRHPNYFGECLAWWGLWLLGTTAELWWTIAAPLLMTVLLLRISGVTLLERDLLQRRAGYDAYVASTNAFLPSWLRRSRSS